MRLRFVVYVGELRVCSVFERRLDLMPGVAEERVVFFPFPSPRLFPVLFFILECDRRGGHRRIPNEKHGPLQCADGAVGTGPSQSSSASSWPFVLGAHRERGCLRFWRAGREPSGAYQRDVWVIGRASRRSTSLTNLGEVSATRREAQ